MSFDYEPLDLEEIKNEASRVNEGSQQGNFLDNFVKLPEGEGSILLRILPRKKGKEFYCATKIHNLADSQGRKRAYHSPQQLTRTDRGLRWTGDSVINRYLRDLWAKSEKVSGEEQKALRDQYSQTKGVERYYYNVIVRSEKDSKTGEVKANVGPKIFSCGKTVHAMIMRAITGEQNVGIAPLGDITDPLKGRDFRLIKKVVKGRDGQSFPNYDLSSFVDVSRLGSDEEIKQWLSSMHDLQALRVVKSEEELTKALKVHIGEETEESDTSESTNVKQPSSTVKAVEEPPFDVKNAQDDSIMPDDEFMKELDKMDVS